MKKMIDMAVFRKKNHLSQQQVADFLGTSKSYVSRVECGRSSLSDENIHRLVTESDWDTAPLIPNFERFSAAWEEYNRINGINTTIWPLEDHNPFGLGDSIVAGLFYGTFGIDESIANSIISVIPTINRNWLLTGEGQMIDKHQNANNDLRTEISLLRKDVRRISEQLEALVNLISNRTDI